MIDAKDYIIPNPEIAPYLNPTYWGGAMLGQPNPRPTRERTIAWNTVQASVWVEGYLQTRDRVSPVRIYANEEVIDPNEYREGTLFYANREELAGTRMGVQALDNTEICVPAETELVPRTDTNLTLLTVDDAMNDIEDGFSRLERKVDPSFGIGYFAMRSFLVVLGSRSHKFFQPIDEHVLFRQADGGLISIGSAPRLDSPVTVGVVDHTTTNGDESLRRINSVVMCREQTKLPGRAKTLPALLAALSLKPS